ncbi:hypothetical protein [Streptomyces sp. NPDC058086]|uniref:hypothetical protein n=1 Tax=Streptomyces sp. NPDC058086 TaxID=3346334 RepID=UPI0036EA84D1
MGDSAHATVPFQAQSAAQAILDAVVLGDALAGATSAEAYHLADGPESQWGRVPEGWHVQTALRPKAHLIDQRAMKADHVEDRVGAVARRAGAFARPSDRSRR